MSQCRYVADLLRLYRYYVLAGSRYPVTDMINAWFPGIDHTRWICAIFEDFASVEVGNPRKNKAPDLDS